MQAIGVLLMVGSFFLRNIHYIERFVRKESDEFQTIWFGDRDFCGWRYLDGIRLFI
ncbi:hypothetical protein JOC54_003239 [Alkalihalobacillus xiaoxiensis]|uniref:Uncharacterized protein n=1 Tax=Shouchella xiaoxiensis TaxID=766895 RepID=A0ABS2SWP5_9BACI|nr:hypothetical protein [Shouchella xiaoxiensis]